jgi:aryl-alcohol dehydrogenase-like predicted oxidoreductase
MLSVIFIQLIEQPMKNRTLHHSDITVSEIGLGCWQLGGADWGIIDDERAFSILRQAIDSGITFFDTADVYGSGRSEELIGQFLRENGLLNKVFVATKFGRMGDLYPDKYTEEGVRQATESSLRRLGVDALDLTQLHCVPTEILRQGEIFDWLRKLRSEGKINRFGASVESDEEGLLCLQQEELSSLQVIFNIFRQKPAVELFNEALKKRVGIIVRLPLASGVLSGKFTQDTRFDEKDHRNYNRDGSAFNVGETFAGIPYAKAVSLADELKSLVPEGLSMASMAQRWILDHEAVTTVITGASRSEQVIQNALVSDLSSLTPELTASIREFYEHSVADQIRGPY